MLAVEKVSPVGFIHRVKDPPAQLGENDQLDVFILDEYCLVSLVDLFGVYVIIYRVRIDAPGGPLVGTPFKE